MAGIILAQKFVKSSAKSFKGFIEYIDRPEAVKLNDMKNYDIFGTYQDYMDEPENSSGLFTQDKDSLSLEEKEILKDVFSESQKRGSVLYQSVISFEDEWLKSVDIKDTFGRLNHDLIQEYTRATVNEVLKKEGMEGFVWSAAVHHNTKHTHIHISMVDPNPKWVEGKGRCYRNAEGELYQRGKWKRSTLDAAKRTFANKALHLEDVNKEINNIMRKRIILNAKERNLYNNFPEIKRSFNALLDSLPEDLRLWKYNMNAMQPFKNDIDNLSTMILNRFYENDINILKSILIDIDDRYKTTYGESKTRSSSFMENKINDLYYRLGNAILTECRNIEINRRKHIQQQMKNTKAYSNFLLNKGISNLRNVFYKNINSIKNQAIYERNRQEEMELNQY